VHARAPDLNGDVGTATVRSVVGSYVLINDQLPSLVAFQACIRSWRRPKATRQRVEGREGDAGCLVRTLDFLQRLLAATARAGAWRLGHRTRTYVLPGSGDPRPNYIYTQLLAAARGRPRLEV
jgi:hypothetical protein